MITVQEYCRLQGINEEELRRRHGYYGHFTEEQLVADLVTHTGNCYWSNAKERIGQLRKLVRQGKDVETNKKLIDSIKMCYQI